MYNVQAQHHNHNNQRLARANDEEGSRKKKNNNNKRFLIIDQALLDLVVRTMLQSAQLTLGVAVLSVYVEGLVLPPGKHQVNNPGYHLQRTPISTVHRRLKPISLDRRMSLDVISRTGDNFDFLGLPSWQDSNVLPAVLDHDDDIEAKDELERLLDERDMLEQEIEDLANYIEGVENGLELPRMSGISYLDEFNLQRDPYEPGRHVDRWANEVEPPLWRSTWQTDASSRYGPRHTEYPVKTGVNQNRHFRRFPLISGTGQRSSFVASGLRDELSFRRGWSDRVTSVALDGDSWILVYDNGSWAASADIPHGIYEVLHTGRTTNPLPVYVSMGSDDQYYIEFANGEYEFVGPPEMTAELETNGRRVSSLAFGETPDTALVVYEDGTWRWFGQIPVELIDALKLAQKGGSAEKVSLGPMGEWALWTKDGQLAWGGLSPDCQEQIESSDLVITDIKFGKFGTFFIRFENY